MVSYWAKKSDFFQDHVGKFPNPKVVFLFYVAECDSGHVKHVAVHGDEPPEKMFCPDCRKMLWVNWDATADRFPLTPRW